jgi:hypothetical protein
MKIWITIKAKIRGSLVKCIHGTETSYKVHAKKQGKEEQKTLKENERKRKCSYEIINKRIMKGTCK